MANNKTRSCHALVQADRELPGSIAGCWSQVHDACCRASRPDQSSCSRDVVLRVQSGLLTHRGTGTLHCAPPDTPSLVAVSQSHFVASSAPDFASPRVIVDHTVIAYPNPGGNPAILPASDVARHRFSFLDRGWQLGGVDVICQLTVSSPPS